MKDTIEQAHDILRHLPAHITSTEDFLSYPPVSDFFKESMKPDQSEKAIAFLLGLLPNGLLPHAVLFAQACATVIDSNAPSIGSEKTFDFHCQLLCALLEQLAPYCVENNEDQANVQLQAHLDRVTAQIESLSDVEQASLEELCERADHLADLIMDRLLGNPDNHRRLCENRRLLALINQCAPSGTVQFDRLRRLKDIDQGQPGPLDPVGHFAMRHLYFTINRPHAWRYNEDWRASITLLAKLTGVALVLLALACGLLVHEAAWSMLAGGVAALSAIGISLIIVLLFLKHEIGKGPARAFERGVLNPAIVCRVEENHIGLLVLAELTIDSPAWGVASVSVKKLPGHTLKVGEHVPVTCNFSEADDRTYFEVARICPIAWGTDDPEVLRQGISQINPKEWQALAALSDRYCDRPTGKGIHTEKFSAEETRLLSKGLTGQERFDASFFEKRFAFDVDSAHARRCKKEWAERDFLFVFLTVIFIFGSFALGVWLFDPSSLWKQITGELLMLGSVAMLAVYLWLKENLRDELAQSRLSPGMICHIDDHSIGVLVWTNPTQTAPESEKKLLSISVRKLPGHRVVLGERVPVLYQASTDQKESLAVPLALATSDAQQLQKGVSWFDPQQWETLASMSGHFTTCKPGENQRVTRLPDGTCIDASGQVRQTFVFSVDAAHARRYNEKWIQDRKNALYALLFLCFPGFAVGYWLLDSETLWVRIVGGGVLLCGGLLALALPFSYGKPKDPFEGALLGPGIVCTTAQNRVGLLVLAQTHGSEHAGWCLVSLTVGALPGHSLTLGERVPVMYRYAETKKTMPTIESVAPLVWGTSQISSVQQAVAQIDPKQWTALSALMDHYREKGDNEGEYIVESLSAEQAQTVGLSLCDPNGTHRNQ